MQQQQQQQQRPGAAGPCLSCCPLPRVSVRLAPGSGDAAAAAAEGQPAAGAVPTPAGGAAAPAGASGGGGRAGIKEQPAESDLTVASGRPPSAAPILDSREVEQRPAPSHWGPPAPVAAGPAGAPAVAAAAAAEAAAVPGGGGGVSSRGGRAAGGSLGAGDVAGEEEEGEEEQEQEEEGQPEWLAEDLQEIGGRSQGSAEQLAPGEMIGRKVGQAGVAQLPCHAGCCGPSHWLPLTSALGAAFRCLAVWSLRLARQQYSLLAPQGFPAGPARWLATPPWQAGGLFFHHGPRDLPVPAHTAPLLSVGGFCAAGRHSPGPQHHLRRRARGPVSGRSILPFCAASSPRGRTGSCPCSEDVARLYVEAQHVACMPRLTTT